MIAAVLPTLGRPGRVHHYPERSCRSRASVRVGCQPRRSNGSTESTTTGHHHQPPRCAAGTCTITSRHHPHRHRQDEPPLLPKGAHVLDAREGVTYTATPSAASPPTSWIFSHSGGFAVHRSLGNATPLPGWNAPRGYAATRFSLLRVPAARLSTDLRPLHERFTTPTCRRRRPAEKASACRPPPFGRYVHYVAQSEYRPGNPQASLDLQEAWQLQMVAIGG